MTGFPRRIAVFGAALVAAFSVVGAPLVASAAPPFPPGAQATPLVGGTPLVQKICPPSGIAGGNSTRGGVSVGSPAGARCSSSSAAADGLYAIVGETPPLPGKLRFSADCANNTGATGGGVGVPVGTNVTGVGVTTQPTVVSTPNTPVTFPNGTTATLNEVDVDTLSVQRIAIRITSGPNAGTLIGRVICGTRYPLAVDVPSIADESASPAIGLSPTADSNSNTPLVAGIAVALLLLVQFPIVRRLRRRGSAATG